MQRKTLYINIADSLCQLVIEDPKLFNLFSREYLSLKTKQKHNFDLVIGLVKREYLFKSRRQKKVLFVKVSDLKTFNEVDFIVRAFISYLLCQYGIIFFHGSAFEKNGRGYVFLGSSGAGKTTVVSGVGKNNRLADDTVIIKKIDKEFYIYSSPFEKKNIKFSIKKRVRVDTFFFLSQDTKTKIEDIDSMVKITSLTENSIYNQFCQFTDQSPKKKGDNLDKNHVKFNRLLFQVLTQVKIKKLSFTKKLDFISDL